MTILKVARLGHPVLRQKASEVEVKDIKAGKFAPLIDDMIETMHAYEGVGLAGPQVFSGHRVFLATAAITIRLPAAAERDSRTRWLAEWKPHRMAIPVSH